MSARKTIPLKTTQQLKADLDLLREELDQARETIDRQVRLMDKMAEKVGRDSLLLVNLFTRIRALGYAELPGATVSFRTWLMMVCFPTFMLKQAGNAARLSYYKQIVTALNEFNFERAHADDAPSKTTATTIKVEKAE